MSRSLSAKVDLLTTNLKENRVTRDSVVHDLDSVNELAVRLNTEKIELLSKMEAQNSKVINLNKLIATLNSLISLYCRWNPYKRSWVR